MFEYKLWSQTTQGLDLNSTPFCEFRQMTSLFLFVKWGLCLCHSDMQKWGRLILIRQLSKATLLWVPKGKR